MVSQWKSFLVVLIEYDHKAIHKFKIPIKPITEWKIVNGIEDDAFKHGSDTDTKYFGNDHKVSVIYYPLK